MFCERSTRGPRVNTMFQVANMVDVVIHWVNGDEVKEILGSKDDLRLWPRSLATERQLIASFIALEDLDVISGTHPTPRLTHSKP